MIETIDGNGLARRDFLRIAGAVALGAAAGPLAALRAGEAGAKKAPWAEEPRPPYAPFRMAVQTYSLRKALQDGKVMVFENVMDAVFFDLRLNLVDLWPEHFPMGLPETEWRKRLKIMRQNNYMGRVSYGVVDFTKDHEGNEEVFEFAKKPLNVHALTANPSPDSFDSLSKLVEKHGIAVAIHNHGPNDKRYGTPDLIEKAIKDRPPLIGLCVDTGHFLLAGVNPVDVVKRFKDRIHAVHLKDVKAEGGKKQECILGQGELDLPGFLRALKDANFKGGLALEYEAEPENPVPSMKKCLEVLQETIKKL